ncbi:MAG: hypothetical protein Tsb002_30080 [Wenzhouxiangellaceae bacterium]
MFYRLSLALAGCLSLFSASAQAQYLRVYYPDIEQGSATVVVAPTGQAMLIDAGTGLKSTDEGIENFINDLIDAGVISSLDYIVATHYDEDHIGRMENVFQLVPLPPTVITYDRGEFISVPATFAYGDYSFGASQHNRTTVPVCTTQALGGGVTFKIWNVNGEVCNGPTVDVSGASQFENNVSVTVVVTFGDVDIWIGGDLTGNPVVGVADVETPTGMSLMDVDVYTVNHHGSETSSNANFLSDLAPEVAINQNSIENGFGHPRATVVSRIKATANSAGQPTIFFQQNPGDPTDNNSDDSLADGIADCDDAAAGEVIGLPGTITLLADGSSYRIHACDIPAQTFAADSGPGTIGDYPPAIRGVLHTPRVPLATEAVTVDAEIEDAASAVIRYWLDDLAQTPLPMSFLGGNSWRGVIPAQPDGVRLRYRVEATDSISQSELSPAACYFSGVTPISMIRLNDAEQVLLTKTCGVRIQGQMTAEPGVFHELVTLAYVQDSTGGVQIFDKTIDPAIARGDVVEWVGEVEQFAGQTEINVAEEFGNFGHQRLGGGTAPAPQVLTVAQAGEASEGQLIRLNGVWVVDGAIPELGSGILTITDDGVNFLTLRVDDTTDIPGANTPTQPFDVIGISSQFDSWVPLTGGYQILPRSKDDFTSDEVNFSQIIISEILVDPANGPNGDANGDGARSATDDEFIEILNTGVTAVDISGWTLSDAATPSSVRHVFPAGTIIPARDAAVVFGGGSPTGSFGTAMAGGRVFTASSGGLSLNNSNGQSVTLADDAGQIVQTVTYTSDALSNQAVVRAPDFSNAPFVAHGSAAGAAGALFSPGTRIDGQFFTIPPDALVLSEVMYDPSGADSGLEWVELFNTTNLTINLTDVCIGSGGGDYTNSLMALEGCAGGQCTIPPQSTFVVGGPVSSADNALPWYDLAVTFSPGLQNSGSTADGVALFNLRCAQVGAATVPVDAVIYGVSNSNGLLDENGNAGSPDVGDVSSGWSVERISLGGAWQGQANPTPNTSPLGGGGNTAPQVSISSPTNGSSFSAGASITFSASASDAEDGDLSTLIDWQSDVDGALGSGASFSLSSLSAGSHQITASVSDSGSLTAQDQISLTITVVGGSGTLLLSEVLYDVTSGDDGNEWIELYNAGATAINLSGWCIGAGGSNYTSTRISLSGTLSPGALWLVGGPNSNASNSSPVYDQVENFSPDLQNSGSVADGVALFDLPCASVTSTTVPVDAVIYGGSNSSNLIDESGSANPPDVGDAGAGASIERTSVGGAWQIQNTPTPNSTGL